MALGAQDGAQGVPEPLIGRSPADRLLEKGDGRAVLVLIAEHASQGIDAFRMVRLGAKVSREQLRGLGEHAQAVRQPPEVPGDGGVFGQELQRPLVGGDGLLELLTHLMGHAESPPDLAVIGAGPHRLARHQEGAAGSRVRERRHLPRSSTESPADGNVPPPRRRRRHRALGSPADAP